MTNEEALKILKYRSGWNLSIRDVNALEMAIKALEQQSCEDAISRQAAIDEIKSHYRVDNDLLEVIAYKIGKLPSVQPKYNPDEWCHDCKEYNHDKHCCPRFNRVIRNAVEEMKQESCEDAISRAEAQTEIEMNASRYTVARERDGMGQVEWSDQLIKVSDAVDIIRYLPSVELQKSEDKE